MFKRIISLTVSAGLLLQQTVFAYTASLNLSNYLSQASNPIVSDRFRPISLRYFSYQPLTNDYKILLDKGDFAKGLSPLALSEVEGQGTVPDQERLKETAGELMRYFLIGVALPDDKFWVNLRPDSEDQIIDDELARTDLGKVMLEADLKLKQDTALFTSPKTPQGKAYWDKLYKKAGELFGSENITIPTLTRPWIVPGEIIIRESKDPASASSQGAYIYKATLKVMLEEDYLKSPQSTVHSPQYNFSDPRLKELNQYSTQLIRELILPKLTQKVNSSKDYAELRQVYFSLILARWFKETYKGETRNQSTETRENSYIKLIDSKDLTNLSSKQAWDKTTYFHAYQKSFKEGEYNLSETVYTSTGQVIRRYMSGGVSPVPEAWQIKNGFTREVNTADSAIEAGKVPYSGNGNGNGFNTPTSPKATVGSAIISLKEAKKILTSVWAIERFHIYRADLGDFLGFVSSFNDITISKLLTGKNKGVEAIEYILRDEQKQIKKEAKVAIINELKKIGWYWSESRGLVKLGQGETGQSGLPIDVYLILDYSKMLSELEAEMNRLEKLRENYKDMTIYYDAYLSQIRVTVQADQKINTFHLIENPIKALTSINRLKEILKNDIESLELKQYTHPELYETTMQVFNFFLLKLNTLADRVKEAAQQSDSPITLHQTVNFLESLRWDSEVYGFWQHYGLWVVIRDKLPGEAKINDQIGYTEARVGKPPHRYTINVQKDVSPKELLEFILSKSKGISLSNESRQKIEQKIKEIEASEGKRQSGSPIAQNIGITKYWQDNFRDEKLSFGDRADLTKKAANFSGEVGAEVAVALTSVFKLRGAYQRVLDIQEETITNAEKLKKTKRVIAELFATTQHETFKETLDNLTERLPGDGFSQKDLEDIIKKPIKDVSDGMAKRLFEDVANENNVILEIRSTEGIGRDALELSEAFQANEAVVPNEIKMELKEIKKAIDDGQNYYRSRKGELYPILNAIIDVIEGTNAFVTNLGGRTLAEIGDSESGATVALVFVPRALGNVPDGYAGQFVTNLGEHAEDFKKLTVTIQGKSYSLGDPKLYAKDPGQIIHYLEYLAAIREQDLSELEEEIVLMDRDREEDFVKALEEIKQARNIKGLQITKIIDGTVAQGKKAAMTKEMFEAAFGRPYGKHLTFISVGGAPEIFMVHAQAAGIPGAVSEVRILSGQMNKDEKGKVMKDKSQGYNFRVIPEKIDEPAEMRALRPGDAEDILVGRKVFLEEDLPGALGIFAFITHSGVFGVEGVKEDPVKGISIVNQLTIKAEKNQEPVVILETKEVSLSTASPIAPMKMEDSRGFYRRIFKQGNVIVMGTNMRFSETIRGIFRAAKETGAPVIIQRSISEFVKGYTPADLARDAQEAADLEGFRGEWMLKLDHATVTEDTEEAIQKVINFVKKAKEAGFASFAIDCSKLVDFTQPTVEEQQKRNSEVTARIVQEADIQDAAWEGEIGEIVGTHKALSRPEEAVAFLKGIKRAGVRLPVLMAVNNGSEHGNVPGMKIDLALTETIFKAIAQFLKEEKEEEEEEIGVNQHGITGTVLELFPELAKVGIRNGNVATHWQNIMWEVIKEKRSDILEQAKTLINTDYLSKDWDKKIRNFSPQLQELLKNDNETKDAITLAIYQSALEHFRAFGARSTISSSGLTNRGGPADFWRVGRTGYSKDLAKVLKRTVAGNWKLRPFADEDEAKAKAEEFRKELEGEGEGEKDPNMVIFVADEWMPVISKVWKGSNISVGVQSFHFNPDGDIDAQIGDADKRGAKVAMIGHSMHRYPNPEVLPWVAALTNEGANKIAKAIVNDGRLKLWYVVAVDEDTEKDFSEQREFFKQQIDQAINVGLDGIRADQVSKITVEPMNDISTKTGAGIVDLKTQVNFPKVEMLMELLTNAISEKFGAGVKMNTGYGASAKPGTTKTLFQHPRIYHILPGGASLEPEDYHAMVTNAKEVKSSSALTEKPNVLGGIDLTKMNMLIQPQGSFASSSLDFSLPMLSRAEIESFDLDQELTALQRMASSGIDPNPERFKEDLAICFAQGRTGREIDRLKSCLEDVLEQHQLEARETPNGYKEVLVVADTRSYVRKEGRF